MTVKEFVELAKKKRAEKRIIDLMKKHDFDLAILLDKELKKVGTEK